MEETSYYFDNEYLKKYLLIDKNFKIFVDKEFLQIGDESDLKDPTTGIGYNQYGEPIKFDYRYITMVVVGGVKYTVEQLNAELGGSSPAGEEGEKSDEAEPKKDDKEVTVDPDKKESISINSYVINEDKKSPMYKTKGVVITINDDLVQYNTYYNGSYITVSCLKENIKLG